MASQPEVTIKSVESATVAFITHQGPFSDFPEVMGKLMAWMAQRGLAPTYAPSGVYYSDPATVAPQDLQWEVRFPIAADVAPEEPNAEGMGVKRVEEAHVAAAVHKGPYPGVGATYGVVAAWIAQNGYQVVGPPEEIYLTNPAETAPEELLTEVRMPIIRA